MCKIKGWCHRRKRDYKQLVQLKKIGKDYDMKINVNKKKVMRVCSNGNKQEQESDTRPLSKFEIERLEAF